MKKRPFENTNDPSFLYQSPNHEEALARMHYAVRQKKLGVVLIGDYGTGKTYLSKVLERSFPEKTHRFIYVTNPRISPLEFIRDMANQLGGSFELSRQPTKIDFLHLVQKGLEDYSSREIHTVIVVDEAQSIQKDELLEEIRLLLNIQGEEAALFTLILLGQPLVEEKIARVPQLKQRLPIRYKLTSLSEEETSKYVEHRLKVAGVTRRIFTDSAHAEIYAFSGGMPREINNVCDLALLSGFIGKQETIDKDTITRIREDLGEPTKSQDTNTDR